MTLSLFLACLWVLAATLTAFLPMRLQMFPGLILLIAAPLLLGFVAHQHGMWLGLLGLIAFLSMFRNPLRYLVKQARAKIAGGLE